MVQHMWCKIVNQLQVFIVNNLLNMRILSFCKGLVSLAFTSVLFTINIQAQNSPFHVRIGYEQLYVGSKITNGIAQKTWTWTRGDDDLIQFRTSLTHAYQLGLSYDIVEWWSINIDFKRYYRRYYVWEGTYLNEEWEGHDAGHFVIVPFVGSLDLPDMFLGSTLATNCWQLGTEFHHRLSKSGKWKMHYYFSLNRDLYEASLLYFDTPVVLEGNGWYNRIEDGKRVEYTTEGTMQFQSTNPGKSQFRASTNIAIAVSRLLKNGMGLRLEFGLRNIRWIKNNLLDENHWSIDLTHTERWKDDNDPHITYFTEDKINYNFPLYLGGFYSNLSFVFTPFRSSRDTQK